MFSKVSIITKFFLLAAILFVVMGIAFSLLTGYIVKRSFLERIRTSTQRAVFAETLTMTQEDFSFKNASQSALIFDHVYQRIKTPEVIRIKVWDKTGRVIYSDDSAIVGKQYPENEELREALRGELAGHIEKPEKSENVTEQIYEQILEVYVPIVPPNKTMPIGVVELYYNLNDVNTRIQETRNILLLSISWFILGTFLLLYLFFKRVVYKLIYELQEATGAIEKGDLSRRVMVRSKDELGQLADSFNTMADKVQDYSVDLEEKVRERTKEVRDRKEELHRVLEASPLGIVISSGPQDLVELVNKKMTEFFGYTIEDVPDGEHWWILAYPDEEYRNKIHTEWEEKVRKARDEKKSDIEPMEARVTCKDGSVKDVEFRSSSTGEKNITVFIDLTEKKKAEARARALDELKNTFIKTVSHQLRTPMSAVRWNLETVLGGEVGKISESQETFLRMTYEASSKIISTIEDLIIAMEIEEKGVRLEKEKTQVDSLVRSVVEQVKSVSQNKKISLQLEISSDGLPAIDVDAAKMREVIRKLIDNALTYTKEGGSIIVKLSKTDSQLHFEVSDTGVGIPKNEQASIFEKFHRASNAYTMKPDSSGLGLFIAKKIIESHGGTLGFTSEEGKGSTFWFELPLHE